MHCIELLLEKAAPLHRVTWALLAASLVACTSVTPPGQPAAATASAGARTHGAAAAGHSRTMRDYQRLAAQRIVSANSGNTYMDAPPDVLLAIPVLEVELHANGSIKRVKVMRYPGQAPETTQMAIDAVHRAAPFGDVSHLPKPWTFVEVFLFRADKRFKPRTLDN